MKTIKLDFGEFLIYKDFIISIINEGVLLDKKHSESLMKMCREQFGNSPFGFIAFRIFSYSIDPMVYHKMSSFKNLVGIAIVRDERPTYGNGYDIEKLLFKGRLCYFDNLGAAEKWISTLLWKHKETHKKLRSKSP